MAKTLEELRKEYPEQVAQLEREAKASAVADAGAPSGVTPAAAAQAPAAPAPQTIAAQPAADPVAAERERIKAIDEIAPSIRDKKMVEDAKYGNPCTAEQLAFRAMKAQQAQGEQYLADIQTDTAASGVAKVQTPAAPAAEADPDSPEAEAAQAKADMAAWEKMQKEGK